MPADLPEGNGIASKYPGDLGIEEDPAVILADGFEDCSSPADLRSKWDALYHDANMLITEEPDNVHGGRRALELTVPQQEASLAIGVDKELVKEQELAGKIKTIVGGAPVSETFAREIGADAYGFDAANAVDRVKSLTTA